MQDADIELTESLDYEQTEPEPDEEALSASKYEIFSYPADTPLKVYMEQWSNNQLLVPEFQREYVWDQTRASKLIESFLLGLPVPPVFLYKKSGSKNFQIIDGQQRIRSIVYFQKGIFGESRFILKGVDSRWDGKAFEQLSQEERFALETSVLRAIVIQQANPDDHSSIYHIFERLNTGGVRLSAMEVRQCVYSSDLLVKVKEVNKNPAWRKLLGISQPDKRLKDIELLLRVLGLYVRAAEYEKPMKGFINDFCKKFQNNPNSSTEVPAIVSKFVETCEHAFNQLGEKPFHLRGPLNYGALDAVLSTLMKIGEKPDLKSNFAKLRADEAFRQACFFNTSDETAVATRLARANALLG